MTLSNVMREKRITTKELADITGINQRTIEAYRSGRREPNFKAGLEIARALEMDPYELADRLVQE